MGDDAGINSLIRRFCFRFLASPLVRFPTLEEQFSTFHGPRARGVAVVVSVREVSGRL